MVLDTLVGVLVLTLGWAVLYGSVNQYRTKMMIEETPTQPVRSIALGRVEVKGEVEPFEAALESPFSQTECVLYRYTIDEWVESDDGESGWVSVEIGTHHSRFYLNDGTARVVVDPANAEVDLERASYEVAEGDAESEAIEAFLSERADRIENREDVPGVGGSLSTFLGDGSVRYGDAGDLVGDESRPRRYVEEYLPVGQELYVFGQAVSKEGVSSPDNPENVLIRHDDRLPTYRVSPKSEAELVESLESRVKWGLAIGAGIAGFGFLWVLLVAGPILGVAVTPLSIGVGILFNRVIDLSRVRLVDAD